MPSAAGQALVDTADTPIPRADAAMYVAKNAGKRRVAYLREGEWVVSS